MSENKVEYGLEQVHIAFFDEDGVQPAYETPIAIPGAVRFTPTAVGASSTFWADNRAYFVITSNDGYTAEWETALIPDAVKARMFGWEVDSNGMIVEISDGIPEKFALLGQVQGDKRNRRFVYWDCQASRPAKERNTKAENITPNTDVSNLTIAPVEIGGKKMVQGQMEYSDTNAAAYNGFFGGVYKPTFGGVGGA